MIDIQNLFKSYEKPVIRDFSFTFPHKGLFLLRGPSGGGKTTLLRLIAGLEKADSGHIRSDHVYSVVFQEPRLVPYLTLEDNLFLVRKQQNKDEAQNILLRLGLWEDRKKFPKELSGGMKLRASIARSLYYGGDCYLWDEPTKELDPKNRDLICTIARELAEKALVIAVTHDPLFQGDEEIHLEF